jgi:flagellar biosynthetic protein FliO
VVLKKFAFPSFNFRPALLPLAALAGLLFFAFWLLRRRDGGPQPLRVLQQQAMNVIETITLAPGRQIVLVEVSGSALVLGVTQRSVSVLDRLSLTDLAENYQPTVQDIIRRGTAMEYADEAPRYAVAGGGSIARTTLPRRQSPQRSPALSVEDLMRQRAASKANPGLSVLENGSDA